MCNNGCMLEMSVKHIHTTDPSACWIGFFVGGSQLVGYVSLPRRCMKDSQEFIKNCSGSGTLSIFFPPSKYSELCRAGSCPKADPVQGTGLLVSCGVWFSCMTSDHSMPSCKSFLRIEQAQCLGSAWASPPQPEETWLFSPTHLQTTWSPCGEDAVYVKETDN